MDNTTLKVTGEVARPREFTYAELCQIDTDFQIPDVSQIDPARVGAAVRLEGILQAVQVSGSATFLGLHSSHDDFHASIPLEEVRQRGFFIYRFEDQPLAREKGGPARFYIPDHTSCKTAEIDECANVKFVDHIELTVEKGYDNRPEDEDEHAKLHQQDG